MDAVFAERAVAPFIGFHDLILGLRFAYGDECASGRNRGPKLLKILRN